jgi:hypothetical protein
MSAKLSFPSLKSSAMKIHWKEIKLQTAVEGKTRKKKD